MEEPYYFADEKELFKRIFKISDELTRNIERSGPDASLPHGMQKLNGGAAAQLPDKGECRTPPVSN